MSALLKAYVICEDVNKFSVSFQNTWIIIVLLLLRATKSSIPNSLIIYIIFIDIVFRVRILWQYVPQGIYTRIYYPSIYFLALFNQSIAVEYHMFDICFLLYSADRTTIYMGNTASFERTMEPRSGRGVVRFI